MDNSITRAHLSTALETLIGEVKRLNKDTLSENDIETLLNAIVNKKTDRVVHLALVVAILLYAEYARKGSSP